jgi:hypothetical protein
MTQLRLSHRLGLALGLIWFSTPPFATGAEDSLNVIDNPSGVPNSLADTLIKANPDRFEAVPTANFLKGVDY